MLVTAYNIGFGGKDDFDTGKMLRDYEWKELAEDIYRNVGRAGRIIIYPLDWGGDKQVKDFLSVAGSGRFIKGPTLLQDTEEDENHEYRKIMTPARDAFVGDSRKAIIFDDWIGAKTGKSALGGLVWGIENAEDLGLDHVYLAGMVDFSRMSPFAGRRKYDYSEYVGPVAGLGERAPKAFERLRSDGRTRMIGERKLSIDKVYDRRKLRELKKVLREEKIVSVGDIL